MNYKHLSLQERYYIEARKRAGDTQIEIAKALNRSQSTISKELKRNESKRGYRHKMADKKAKERHTAKNKRVKINCEIEAEITRLIKKKWSPEQIAGRLKVQNIIDIHHETIYRLVRVDKVNGGELYKSLRRGGKSYRKLYFTSNGKSGIPNRVGI